MIFKGGQGLAGQQAFTRIILEHKILLFKSVLALELKLGQPKLSLQVHMEYCYA